MGRTLLTCVVGGCLWCMAACGGPPVKAWQDYDPSYDFTRVATYAWAKQPVGGDPKRPSDLERRRVQAAVDEQLAAKGLHKLDDTGEADAMVLWYSAMQTKLELRELDYSLIDPLPERMADTFEQGTLVVDIVSRTEKRLLWRGTAQARVDLTLSPEAKDERVRTAVAKMFEEYPPE